MGSRIVDGCWITDPIHHTAEVTPLRVVNTPAPMATVDDLVQHLTAILVATRDLSHADQKRMYSFMHASLSLISAQTVLEPKDKRLFERELHAAVVKQQG